MSKLNIINSNKKSSDVHQSFSFLSDLDWILLRNIHQSSAHAPQMSPDFAEFFNRMLITTAGFCYATSIKAPL